MTREEVNALFKEMAQYKLMMDEAKAEYEALQKKVQDYMTESGSDTLVGDEHKATWKEEVQNRFDSAAFKKDHADVYESYRKPQTMRKFKFA